MGTIKQVDVTPEVVSPGRTRYLAHTDHLMLVVMDFNDGPAAQPDPPHSHPHEQVSCVAAGELIFFLNGNPTRLSAGDLYTVPPNIPHCVQPLTRHVRLIDSFTPIRKDFLK